MDLIMRFYLLSFKNQYNYLKINNIIINYIYTKPIRQNNVFNTHLTHLTPICLEFNIFEIKFVIYNY